MKLFFSSIEVDHRWWFSALLKWHAPLKIEFICCFALENRILTWEIFVKSGGNGPNTCFIYHNEVESFDHIMIHCTFAKLVWKEFKKELKIAHNWSLHSLTQCF